MKEISRALAAVLFACGIAGSLGACGSNNPQTDSTGIRSPQGAVAVEPPPQAPGQKHDRSTEPEAKSGVGRPDERSNRGGGTGIVAEADSAAESKPADGARDNRAEGGACPGQLSRRECRELESAANGGPTKVGHSVKTSECPPAMSQGDCQSVGKAYEEAQAGGKVVSPSECPPAMTEAQCVEAGKAYEEAAK
jgi:hypothetical protein